MTSKDRSREHRPAPAHMRRSSRTHWPALPVLLWIAAQVAAVMLLVVLLVALLAWSSRVTSG